MPSRIELQELSNELNYTKQKFDRWKDMIKTETSGAVERHLRNIQEQRGTILALQQRQETLSKQAEELKQRIQVEKVEEAALRDELAAIQAEEADLPAQLSALQSALDSELSELQRKDTALQDAAAIKKKKLDALQQALSCYQSRLGLTFQHPEGSEELQVVFTHIDATEPERQFMFAVHVIEDDKYIVTSCHPCLEGVDVLLSELNETSNFSAFVRSMRSKFQALV